MTIEAQPKTAAIPGGQSLYLDLMRGLASQLVLLGHSLNIALPAWFMTDDGSGSLTARPGLPYLQSFGVLVFFYLSGFLITSSAARKSRRPEYRLQHFVADRFARIFTPLLPMLLLVYVIDNLVFGPGEKSAYSDVNSGLGDLLLNAAMLAGNPALSFLSRTAGIGWLSSASFGTADQLWTVIIEWWIYMVFGVGFFALARRRQWTRLSTIVCLGLLGVAAPVLLGTLMQAPGLLLAWALGMLASSHLEIAARLGRRRLAAIALAALCADVVILVSNGWNFYAPLPAVLIGIVFFVPLAAANDLRLIGDSRVLSGLVRYASNISYSLYLVHLSLIIWMAHLFPKLLGHPATVALYFVLANLAAWLLYLAFERHYPAVRLWLAPYLRSDRARGTPAAGDA